MNQNFYFPVPDQLISKTHCNNSNYLEMYQKSIEDPESFWKDQGQRIDWYKPYTKVKEVNFTTRSKICLFDLNGEMYFDPPFLNVGDEKYEGLEFL